MSYLGNTPTTQAFTPAIDYFSGNGSTVAFTLSRPVASVAQVQVNVNNVQQNPSTAFTVSGNTITFTGAPSTGTNNIYVEYTSPITQVNALTQGPAVIGPMYVSIGGGTPIGGATNPIMGLSGSSNNYVQGYVNNNTNGVNSSADFVAYPSNGTDVSGWVDMGVTSLTYSQAAFSVTGPNEAYVFGSAPSGSGTTGNLVIATDSTGTANSIQFYTNGFSQAKSAAKMVIDGSGNVMIGAPTNTTSAIFEVASANKAMASGTGQFQVYTTNSQAADLGGQIVMGGSYSGTSPTTFAAVSGRKENSTNANIAGYLSFGTCKDAVGMVEQARIDSSGNLKFNSGYGSVATAYGCRAWVNFNGTGTVAIRASGNVTSITDNGVGDYTVNFTTAMPDANYGVSAITQRNITGDSNLQVSLYQGTSVTQTSAGCRLAVRQASTAAVEDPLVLCASIFR